MFKHYAMKTWKSGIEVHIIVTSIGEVSGQFHVMPASPPYDDLFLGNMMTLDTASKHIYGRVKFGWKNFFLCVNMVLICVWNTHANKFRHTVCINYLSHLPFRYMT